MQKGIVRKAAIVSLALAIVVPAASYAAARGFAARVPVSMEVEYWIHSLSADNANDVTFKVKLSLMKGAVDGDSIGWEISSIEFRDLGTPDSVWVDSSPNVPSADGLWWIDHSDANNPQTAEFAVPPHLTGTGALQDPDGADLGYDFEGFVYTPPPGQSPYAVTASLDYYFAALLLPPFVLETAEKEPVEMPPIIHPGRPS